MRRYLVLVAFVTLCSFVHGQCGGTYSGYSGSIVSDPYVANMYCTYQITPPSSAYTYVQITFTTFSTEQGYDFVSVFDGPSTNSEAISRFSGWTIPPTFKSSQPYMTILFQTDEYVSMDGWTLTYQFYTGTPPSCAGPRWLTDVTATEISRTVLGNSSSTVTCDYIINTATLYYDGYGYECTEYMTVSLNYWDDTTQSAVADVYSGQNEWGVWYGSFHENSELGSTLWIENNYYGQLFIRYNVLTQPGSSSSYSMTVAVQTSCDSGSNDHHSTASMFLVWFIPLLCSLICLTCVLITIAYKNSKRKQIQQTSKYQNLAVPLQNVSPQLQDGAQVIVPSQTPPPFITVPQGSPYPTAYPPNPVYQPYNPMYGAPVAIAQPVPGLFPTTTVLHTFQPMQPMPQPIPNQQEGQPSIVSLEEHN